MEEILKEVLIKECGEMLHDKVFIVENLPKKFLYEKTVKMVQHVGEGGFRNGTLVPDPSGHFTDTLYPGIERSATGDGGFLFWITDRESRERLMDIDRYIERTLPRDTRIVRRIPYAQQVGNPASPPIPYSQIPRMVLPVLEIVTPPQPRVEEKPAVIEMSPQDQERQAEINARRRAALEKARAARKAKKEQAVA